MTGAENGRVTPAGRFPVVRGTAGGVASAVGNGASRRAQGFTLIELIIVVAIIGILATIAVPAMRTAPQKAKEAVLKEDLFTMRSCIDQYLGDKGHYPPSLEALVDEGYLRRIPVDPITQRDDSWVVDYASAEDEASLQPTDEEGGGPGIIDVHSGAEGETLDKKPYSEL